jgi:hypothetical protein
MDNPTQQTVDEIWHELGGKFVWGQAVLSYFATRNTHLNWADIPDFTNSLLISIESLLKHTRSVFLCSCKKALTVIVYQADTLWS